MLKRLSSASDETPSSPTNSDQYIKPSLHTSKNVTTPSAKKKSRKTPSPKSDADSPNHEETPTSPSPTKKPKGAVVNGTWDPEKRELFMDRVIATGYKAIDMESLAAEVSDGGTGRSWVRTQEREADDTSWEWARSNLSTS